ncbi:MAG TPA: D-alanyl-D-alanine carboxypeptidase family protein [Rhizomicrobium sp.]|jgi:D-alanyl-D-alanine carboxypeptidase|nr:D-alanyl-D-alanine carboxypeptidase family protein [Rhizomicrobium sp.]
MLACVLSAGAAAAVDAPPPDHGRRLTDPDLDAALAVDEATGRVLYARNADAPRHPASLTKMMTLYLLFETLRDRAVRLDTAFRVSANAAVQPRSHIRLRAGETISAEMAIQAIAVGSANDAAVTVAEALGGSEAHFAQMMTAKARQLGMAHTVFHNATGLPDDLQQTTATDLAVLARHLIHDFPQYFGYFQMQQMTWRGEDYNTHNSLLANYAGADGIKTGYTDASGYNLVGTAQRGGRRVIAVVMGGLTAEKRDEAMVALLDDSFAVAPVAPAPIVAIVVPRRRALDPPVTFILVEKKPTRSQCTPIALGAAVVDPLSPLLWPLAAIACAVVR